MSMLINYPIILPRKTRTLFLPAQPQEIHPLHKKLELLAYHLSGTSPQGISKEASELLFKSWRTGTQKQYRTYLERWKLFCTSRKVNPLCGTITNAIDFLITQCKRGLTYSSLNTARCALSTVILLPNGNTFGNHPLVTRLMKGVFESRPTLPRYNSIWNLSTVLDFIKTLGPNEELSLINVTLKCVTLVALLSGQRCQTIHALRISGMKETNGQIRFDISTLLKTSKPGKHQEPLTFKPYTYDSQLCVVKCLQQYINKQQKFVMGLTSYGLVTITQLAKIQSADG